MDVICSHLYVFVMRAEVSIAAETQCWGGWHWRNTRKPTGSLNFWFIAHGPGNWRDEYHHYQLRAGDCFLQRLWLPGDGWSDEATGPLVLWASFTLHDDDGPIDLVHAELPPTHRHIADHQPLVHMAKRMIDAPSGSTLRNDWMTSIYNEIIAIDASSPMHLKHDADAPIRACRDDILGDPAAEWNIGAMAKHCQMSPSQFTRRFKQVTGMTPRHFVQHARIERAKEFLLVSDQSIGDIADALGFTDIYHFSRRFRQYAGTCPSDFRRGAAHTG